MSDWKEDSLRHKYDPLPEEPRFKKKRKKHHVRSDHKHEYEKVCIDAHTEAITREGRMPMYHIGIRCKVCGRLKDLKWWQHEKEPPDGVPLYEVGDFLDLVSMKALPESMKVRD